MLNQQDCRIRSGTEEDLPFIKKLAVQACETSIPPTRNAPVFKVRASVEQFINMLPQIALTLPLRTYILEVIKTKEKIGYIILLLNQLEPSTGEKQTIIQDYALLPQYRGKHLWKLLLEKAEEVAIENGNFYLTGLVTISNKASFVTAEKFGFQVERYQVVKKLPQNQ